MSLFVTFEGIEGAGKSSIISSVASIFRSNNRDVIVTNEPGATGLGEQIRALLLSKGSFRIASRSELFLFLADRTQHVEEVIRPALSMGTVVLCDRYVDSTIAYQGYARGLPIDELSILSDISTQGLAPDKTVLLDLDPSIGLGRARKRASQHDANGTWNRFEEETLAFHSAVRSGFLDLASKNKERFIVVDASQPFPVVEASVLEALSELL